MCDKNIEIINEQKIYRVQDFLEWFIIYYNEHENNLLR